MSAKPRMFIITIFRGEDPSKTHIGGYVSKLPKIATITCYLLLVTCCLSLVINEYQPKTQPKKLFFAIFASFHSLLSRHLVATRVTRVTSHESHESRESQVRRVTSHESQESQVTRVTRVTRVMSHESHES